MIQRSHELPPPTKQSNIIYTGSALLATTPPTALTLGHSQQATHWLSSRAQSLKPCSYGSAACTLKHSPSNIPHPQHTLLGNNTSLSSRKSDMEWAETHHVATLWDLVIFGILCIQLCPPVLPSHFLMAPQDSILPASHFIPLGTSLLVPGIRHLLTLCTSTNFIYLLTHLLKNFSYAPHLYFQGT